MQTKKTIALIVFILALFCCVHLASAQGYTPLVRIPGLPTSGTVNLSMYLVGIYNFLLSIVGIVAVMMLIIGGMRYITAAGNQAAAGDAKDIISNAIIGLLLALLSWVFIATINPDVLYIKKPVLTDYNVYNPKCTVSLATDDPCLCIDKSVIPLGTYTTCNKACKEEGKCTSQESVSCTADKVNNIGDVTSKGCVCANGATTVAGKKKEANLVLAVDNAGPAVGAMITLTATLTDSDSGGFLGGRKIIFNNINNSLNASGSSLADMALASLPTLTNAGTGVSTYFFSVNCASVDQWQAIFASEATDIYAPVGSNIITVSSVGAPVCNLADYSIKPAAEIWKKENLHTCDNYCMDNCGYGYLKIKAAPENGEFKDDKSLGYNYFVMGDTSKLFEFFPISDGIFGSFNIEKRFWVTAGGETYSCAILLTLENVAPDTHCIYWVKEGVTIKKNGVSLREDIESSGIPNSWDHCCGLFPIVVSSCAHDLWAFCTTNMCAAELATPGNPWTCAATDDGDRLWSAQYRTGLNIGNCENCSLFQGEDGSIYKPARDITCKRDFLGRGVWE